MKKFSILKGKIHGLVILGFFCIVGWHSKAQSIHIAAGTVLSQYDYVSSDGDRFDNFKRGSGTYFRMGAEFKMLDTLALLTSTSPKAFYYSNHRSLANFLSRVNVETSVESNQLNSVGDILGVVFNYQTNYLGLNLGLGYVQPIYKGWSLKATGKVQGMKIIQGNQELLGKYKDLTLDPDFNKLQIALGWEFSLSKQVNPGLVSFISFSKSNTVNAVKAGSSSLNFNNTMFSIGLKFNTINK
jgi:hypothetical protein